MVSVRIVHTYLGMLIAPSVVFFALTGALQLFSLHEAHGDYQPPNVLEKLSAVHKDQVFELKKNEVPDDPPSETEPSSTTEARDVEGSHTATLVLKWVFLLVALGLAASTLLGVWMALQYPLRRKKYIWLLILGGVLPTAVVWLSTLSG